MHRIPSSYCVILGKKCFVLAKARALAFLGRGSLWPQDPRDKKSHCFSYEKQIFSSPRMTRVVSG
ncbi:MAG: hypothetical protein BGO67_08120 [Alphaproteobacteria bacterium 41-28]|nr:MAG: hypothetical protein BGO67_08120 [Alphaproteobacteria bacterium 41-28]